MDQPPAFCYGCGAPYPWTVSSLEAAKELTGEFDELDEKERELLAGTFDALTKDSPKTELAVTRFKKLAKKLGTDSYESIKKILVDIVSEAVRKSVFGP